MAATGKMQVFTRCPNATSKRKTMSALGFSPLIMINARSPASHYEISTFFAWRRHQGIELSEQNS